MTFSTKMPSIRRIFQLAVSQNQFKSVRVSIYFYFLYFQFFAIFFKIESNQQGAQHKSLKPLFTWLGLNYKRIVSSDHQERYFRRGPQLENLINFKLLKVGSDMVTKIILKPGDTLLSTLGHVILMTSSNAI